MARKRNRKGFRVIRIKKALALSTLADNTVLSGAVGSALTHELYCMSGRLTITKRGGTTGEGPLLVGLSHPDLSDAEIQECLDAAYTGDEDIVTNEQRRRPVRTIGAFTGISQDEVLNDGKPIKVKIHIRCEDGKSVPSIWVRNESGAALTTGCTVEVFGDLYCRKT